MKARVSVEKLIVIVLVALIALVTVQVPNRVLAQKIEKTRTSHAPSSVKTESGRATVTKTATVPVNAEYSAKIKEYTTQSYFSTELVDYLVRRRQIIHQFSAEIRLRRVLLFQH